MQFLARHKLDMRNWQMCLLCQSGRYFFLRLYDYICSICICVYIYAYANTHTHSHTTLELKYLSILCASMQILLALYPRRFDLKGSDAHARFPGSKEQAQMLNYLSIHSHLHTHIHKITHTHKPNKVKCNFLQNCCL